MSFDETKNGDDESNLFEIHYAMLKSSLISNIGLMRQELLLLKQTDTKLEKETIRSSLQNIADRRDQLIDISKLSLSPEDHAIYKNFIEKSIDLYFKTFDLKKLKVKERRI